MRGLKDKVAIVAGAAPCNIEGATAVRLAEEGAAVVAADLNEAAAQSVVEAGLRRHHRHRAPGSRGHPARGSGVGTAPSSSTYRISLTPLRGPGCDVEATRLFFREVTELQHQRG
jgi:NAD(P)-dependent dehydrogenase (short-subunit alcohol dehydrogenase family)